MRARHMLTALTLLAAFAAAGCSFFGARRAAYDFSGVVVSMKDGAPIAGAKVTAACDEPKQDASETTTNASGVFRLQKTFSGKIAECGLAFEHPRYKTKAFKIDPHGVVKTGAVTTSNMTVELEPE